MKSIASRAAGLVFALVTTACVNPFEGLGQQVINSTSQKDEAQTQILDDQIEDKHPTYDESFAVTESFGEHCQITLNKTGSVTKLEVKPWSAAEVAATALFPNRGAALEVLGSLQDGVVLPSMEVVNGSLKPFNDGLYAAIELAMLEGAQGISGTTPGIIDGLLVKLSALQTTTDAQKSAVDSARVFLGAARIVSGGTPDLPEPLLSQAQAEVVTFQANAEASRPIGFYTWSEPLQRAFGLVRFLQNREDKGNARLGAFAAMAVALEQDEALLAQYQSLLALYAGLTNPYVAYTPASLLPYVDGLSSLDSLDSLRSHFTEHLFACAGPDFAFVPTSRANEADYFDAKYCLTPVPAGTSFLDEFVEAIRTGQLDLAPKPDSGWYDYQQYALETLLVPEKAAEKDHLLLTAAYKKKLIDTFKSILIQNRETHVAHAASFGAGAAAPAPIVDVYPNFKVEPFPTFYLRTARAYRFLSTYLTGVLGAEFLQSQHSLREAGGPSGQSLQDELRSKARLLYGLYLASAKAVGLKPELLPEELAEFDEAGCEVAARAWFQTWKTDADILADPRVVVPAGQNDGHLVLWAVIGVKALKIGTSFVEGYEPKIVGAQGCEAGKIVGKDYYLLTEETAEVQLQREGGAPPTRAEFRAVCDAKKTREAIVAAVEAL